MQEVQRMRKFLVAIVLLASACTTQEVTLGCKDTNEVLAAVAPFLSAAPGSVQLAVTALSAGSYACGTPQYAAARDVVMAWVKGLAKKAP
jgi:hypothetical protein